LAKTYHPLNYECPKNEAVFYDRLLYSSPTNKLSKDILDQMAIYFEHLDKTGDRLLVLTAELLLENAIDRYLSALMPSYKKNLSENKEFAFSLKIAVTRSLRLSPPKFFGSIDLIRKIRNQFVHNLEITKLDMLNSKIQKEISEKLVFYVDKGAFTQKNLQERFRSLSLFTFYGLNRQIENVRSLNVFLRDDNFLNNLTDFFAQRSKHTRKDLSDGNSKPAKSRQLIGTS
jgi:hypothetical protein